MRFAVLVFPGTWSERDCQYVLTDGLGQQADLVWHREANLDPYDAVVIPGGFSYGDHLRTGAIARFSPVMGAVAEHAECGKPVIGICNGFQILCESHLLPGALIRNDHRKFVCRDQELVVENTTTLWTSSYQTGQHIVVPLKNGEGGYLADEDTLDRLEGEGRVVVRYVGDNPNGSYRGVAGVTNERGNVVGLMPHPEHAVEELTGPTTDGLGFFTSLLESAVSA